MSKCGEMTTAYLPLNPLPKGKGLLTAKGMVLFASLYTMLFNTLFTQLDKTLPKIL
jgi:hypothetical protein